ncbi:translation initiation factor IF-2-like [Vidua chalybeata]|uniref:translation initiation factor IF-2-like n=1 Tax=Vidua chalybeata TaxID=81927 RepID=UPI0023A7B5ED|nr:translation initiation factor IF-2-like [Vidua chalybeata]
MALSGPKLESRVEASHSERRLKNFAVSLFYPRLFEVLSSVHDAISHQLQLQLQSRPGTPRVPAAPRARRQGLVSRGPAGTGACPRRCPHPRPPPALPALVAVVTVVAPAASRLSPAGAQGWGVACSSIRGRGSQLFGRGWRCPTHPAGTAPPTREVPPCPLPRGLGCRATSAGAGLVLKGTNRWIGAASAEQEGQPRGRLGETPEPSGRREPGGAGGEPAPRLRLSAPRKDEFGGASAPRTTWMSGERLGLSRGPGEQHPRRGGPSQSPLTAAPGPARGPLRGGAGGASLGRGGVNRVNDVQT